MRPTGARRPEIPRVPAGFAGDPSPAAVQRGGGRALCTRTVRSSMCECTLGEVHFLVPYKHRQERASRAKRLHICHCSATTFAQRDEERPPCRAGAAPHLPGSRERARWPAPARRSPVPPDVPAARDGGARAPRPERARGVRAEAVGGEHAGGVRGRACAPRRHRRRSRGGPRSAAVARARVDCEGETTPTQPWP